MDNAKTRNSNGRKTNLRILMIDDNPKTHHNCIKILTTNASHTKQVDEMAQQLFETLPPAPLNDPLHLG